MKNSKFKNLLLQVTLLLSAFLILHSSFADAGQLTPVVAWLTDSQGNAYGAGTNVTITAWPATNIISGVGTNLVANLPIIDVTGTSGRISNNLAPGNYRMQIAGFPRGITFGVVSNGAALNVAQLAGIPVPEFMNFSIAQFSDAGTMAYQSTNNWTANSYLGVSNALGFVIATNGGPVAIAQLPYTPPTNTYSALTNVLGYVPATNGGPIAIAQLPYLPATNSYTGISNAVGFVIATNGGPVAIAQLPYTPPTNTYSALTNVLGFIPATNGGPIVITQLPYSPATNSYAGISNAVGFIIATNGGPVAVTQLPYLPATNGGAISNRQLTTNVLTTYGFGPVSFTTNFGIIWAVFQTNGLMGNTLTNLPSGSICTTTNGQFFVLSNATWLVK